MTGLFRVVLGLVLGLCVGSFLGVVADRLPRGESVVAPPSHCPHCGRRLGAAELVPVLSYLRLRGRCRSCGAPIPRRDFVIEVLSAAGTAWLLWEIWGNPLLYPGLVVLYLGISAAAIDLAHRLIPNRLLIAAAALALLALAPSGGSAYLDGLIGGLGLLAVGLAIAVLGRGGFGMGDVKYLGVVGLLLGWRSGLLALCLAVVLGGLYAAGLLATRRARRSDAIAFGPFIAVGSLIAVSYGPQLIGAYLHLV